MTQDEAFLKQTIALFNSQKYRSIILNYFAISFLVVGAALYELGTSHYAEVKRAEVQSNNLSQVLEAQIAGTFKKIDLILQDVVRTVQNKKFNNRINQEEIKQFLSDRYKDIPEAKVFFLVDQNGYDVFRGKGNTIYLGDRDYFQEQKNAVTNEMIISKPFYGKVTGLQSISFSRRIVNNKNKFQGIIAVAVPLTYFRDLYARLDIGTRGAISLVSNENIVYARYPWDESLIGNVRDEKNVIDKIFTNKERMISATKTSVVDGLARFSTSRRIADSKFFVSVGISKDEVLAQWKKRCKMYLIGFTMLWIGGLIYLFRFLKSLQELDERRKIAVQTAKLTSLGEMASGIAHEINNPLTVIVSRTNLLKRYIDRNQYDPESFKDSLTKITKTVERISRIIQGLKAFSRDADHDALAPTSLKDIIESTLNLCGEKFRHQLVLLKVDPVPDLTIDCRESQLVHVLLNVLSNAYDAVERMDERWVHLSFQITKPNSLSICITDSGKGIPDIIAQNIMQPFFTTKEVGRGTGLGLSISKGIIEDHKGKFFLDKESLHTKFVIELPLSLAHYVNYDLMQDAR